jgi:predicted DNA-binding transcriptional regulator YafY
MRADRLVSILLFLQRHPNGVTAGAVAEELEISERTARRDLEALASAGLPVYSCAGRGGGWRLLGGGRTDLSGLNAPEMRALFTVAGPQSASSPVLKAAVRKLVRALPEPMRDEADMLQRLVLVDGRDWNRTTELRGDPPLLDTVQQALVRSRELIIDYVRGDGAASVRSVRPLGLAMKRTVWYLVADTDAGQRTFRLDRMRSADVTETTFKPPEGFVLEEAWRMITEEVSGQRDASIASLAVREQALRHLRRLFGAALRIGPPEQAGWVQCEVSGHSYRALAGVLAGFGGDVQIHNPSELRSELAEIGRQLIATNTGHAGHPDDTRIG